MAVSHHLGRAALLLQQSRYADAEKAARQALHENPNDIQALSILASCLAALDRAEEALKTVERAIALAPSAPELLYQRAYVLYLLQREPEALRQVNEAIRLDPTEADHFALRAELLLKMKKYEDALSAANEGLALDPENSFCLNVRASALMRLKRADEALETIATSLENEPENSYTHTNFGWSKLENGRHREALEHFKEALRLAPNNDYARAGMVEAIKAKNPLYRLFLRYVFWMAGLSARYQWALIIGAYVLFRLLRGVAADNPALEPFVWPVLVLYLIFALSTWLLSPIANLFLFLDTYGRYALSKDERLSSSLVGAALGMGLLLLLGAWWWNSEPLLYFSLGFIGMMIPLGSMLSTHEPRRRRRLVGFTAVLGVILLSATVPMYLQDINLADTILMFFFLGLFAYQWVANFQLGPKY